MYTLKTELLKSREKIGPLKRQNCFYFLCAVEVAIRVILWQQNDEKGEIQRGHKKQTEKLEQRETFLAPESMSTRREFKSIFMDCHGKKKKNFREKRKKEEFLPNCQTKRLNGSEK